MPKLVAITQIWAASGRMISTGRFDAEGNPVLQVETLITKAGSVFDATEEEAEKLIANRAAAPIDDMDPYWRRNAPEQTEEGN